jgi:hypothetical protein
MISGCFYIKPSYCIVLITSCQLHMEIKNCIVMKNLMIYNMQEDTSKDTQYLQARISKKNAHISRKTTSMSTQMALSLHTLPVELVYRILDSLDNQTIILSCRNVCARLNDIIDTYHRYQVIFDFIVKFHMTSLSNRSHPINAQDSRRYFYNHKNF